MTKWTQQPMTAEDYFTKKGKRIPNILLKINGHGNDWATHSIDMVATPEVGPRFHGVKFAVPGRRAEPFDFQENGKRKTRFRFLVDTGSGFIVCMFDRFVNASVVRDLMNDGDVYVIPAPKPRPLKSEPEIPTIVPSVGPMELFGL